MITVSTQIHRVVFSLQVAKQGVFSFVANEVREVRKGIGLEQLSDVG